MRGKILLCGDSMLKWVEVKMPSDREQCDAFMATIPDNLRQAVAAEVYRLNDKVTLARAAEIAGVFTWEMADVLREYGVEPEYAEVTVGEMERQIALLETA